MTTFASPALPTPRLTKVYRLEATSVIRLISVSGLMAAAGSWH
jgi:hypothetical protein